MSAQPILAVTADRLRTRRSAAPWRTSGCLVASDFLALSLVYWIAVLGRCALNAKFELSFCLQLFPAILVFIGIFLGQDLYPGLLLHPAEELRRVFRSITTVFLLIACTAFLWRNEDSYSRSVFLITWAAGAPVVLLARKLTRRVLAGREWWGVSAVVFGSGTVAKRVLSTLRQQRHLGLRVVGLLTTDVLDHRTYNEAPVLGNIRNGPAAAAGGIAQYAIIAMADQDRAQVRHAIQEYCIGFRHVLLVPDLPGLCSLHIAGRDIGGELGFELPQRLFHSGSALTKRVVDLSASVVILLALLPVFLAAAVVIRLTSEGPIFFSHLRIGRNGQTFKAWKFRTMYQNASEILRTHLQRNPEALAEWRNDQKLRNDPRITPAGKFLRRYSLDELPQLFNVLAGDMGLVGPRPIVSAEIEKYGTAFSLYTRVLPGITGLWQVSGRNNTTYSERVALDEYYVRNWSVWLDAYILACTVKAVLSADGAY